MADHLKLVSIRVTNFGPFQDTTDVPVEADVTVLLAENENGKTSLLRALGWFSSDEAFDPDDRWDGGPRDGVVDVVSLSFEMNKAAAAALKERALSAPSRVRVVRQSDGVYRVEDPETGDELVRKSSYDSVRDELLDRLKKVTIEEGHETQLDEAVSYVEAAAKADDSTTSSAVTHIRTAIVPHVEVKKAGRLEELCQALEAYAAEDEDPAWAALKGFLPTMIYFGESVEELNDVVTYEDAASAPGDYQTMMNLAALVGEDVTAMASLTPHERQRTSRTTSEQVSDRVSRFWAEGGITLHITFEETRMVVSVTHKERDQKPSRRSRGLRWFLGFYINFKARTNEDLTGAVLLLDEPGLFLHLKQQPKLLELFDDLSRTNQIIYSTQLPKMVPAAKLHRIRLLVPADDTTQTVTVKSKVQAVGSKADVLQPVRAQLGMGIADAISLGNVNIIVEGLIDPYVIDSMRIFCRDAGIPTLSEDVTLFATGGAGKKMLPHVAFLVGDPAKGVVLLDDDAAGHAAEKEINKIFGDLVPTLRVVEDGTKPSGKEIEDLISRAYYLDLTNSAYLGRISSYTDIKPGDVADGPIVDAIQEVFKKRRYGDFQKVYPARQLQIRLQTGEDPPDEETLDQFSGLFERLNDALNAAAAAG